MNAPLTPSTEDATLLDIDELASLSATKSPIAVQEEHIRRAIDAGNRGRAREILAIVEGWTATTDADVDRLRGLILDSYNPELEGSSTAA